VDFPRRIARHADARDLPAVNGQSHLSVQLRFGTISIRGLAAAGHARTGSGAAVWLSEFIWRDF
jgi:deoxyribodipyrimidine photo-lyase